MVKHAPTILLSSPDDTFTNIPALLDPGASLNYIDPKLVQQYNLKTEELDEGIDIHYADGSTANQRTTHTVTMTVCCADQCFADVKFHVSPLTTHQIFLGIPWFLFYGITFDFLALQIGFNVHAQPGKPVEDEVQLSDVDKRNIVSTLSSSTTSRFNLSTDLGTPHSTSPEPPTLAPTVNRSTSSVPRSHPSVPSQTGSPESRLQGPSQHLHTPSTRRLECHSRSTPSWLPQTGRPHLGIHFGIGSDQPPQPSQVIHRLHQTFTSEDNANKKHVPEVFHSFLDVFRKSSADKLPEHRPFDHQIKLQPGTTPDFGKVYSLTQAEQKALREYLDEMLSKGFIRPSSSPAGSPMFFVPKSDGTLRPVVDYRHLNNITVKDRYSIPKIDDLLDVITGALIFSKIDLRGAYNLLRIALGEEWKTAFRTRYGSFEYLVMPFGLCNAPASFQRFINTIFRDMQGIFVVIYLDDILIFSKSQEEHERHVKMVLERLRSANLYAKPEKCAFMQDSVEFLGYKVSAHGVEMVMDKVQAILTWAPPTSVKELQIFLGFANFYRRFVRNYSKLTAPLTELLRKDEVWDWTPARQNAFDELKLAFTTAPILQHFNPSKPIIMETDASDYAIAAVISQHDDNGVLHPVAFRSRKLSAAELNYEIHDKEMLAIVDTFKDWRHLLLDTHHTITVYTDHKNLEYFTSSKLLNRRQARWFILLVDYDFKIIYRPGHQGGKPDALTRRPDYHPGTSHKHFADNNPQNFKTLLNPHQHNLHSSPEQHLPTPHTTTPHHINSISVHPDQELLRKIQAEYAQDPHLQEHRSSYTNTNNLLYKDSRLYVPDALRLDILKARHDHPLAGHHGRLKTLKLVQRDFFWPGMRKFVFNFVDTCDSCSRTKSTRHKPYGLLKSLPVPIKPWADITMDLIEALPPSDGFDSILVVVDRMTKMALFIPTHTNMTSEDLAKLFLKHVFSKHGCPSTLVSDRGSEFTSSFWRSLCKLLNIHQALSTAFHPQTDGQTERVNQSLEQYLRNFTNYQQSDWHELLPFAEFSYNNSDHSTINTTPFFANKGFHPTFDLPSPSSPTPNQDNPYHPLASHLIDHFTSIRTYLNEQIKLANERAAKNYDTKHMTPPDFKIGDQVMLSTRNIKTTRPSNKLDYRFIGPFKILDQVSTHAFRLELPPSMKIHNVFHVSLLEPHKPNTIPHRVQEPPPTIEINGQIEYEVERIVDSKLDRRYACSLRYLVEWTGYTGPDRFTWEPADQLNCPDHIADFHLRYPDKPGPLKA